MPDITELSIMVSCPDWSLPRACQPMVSEPGRGRVRLTSTLALMLGSGLMMLSGCLAMPSPLQDAVVPEHGQLLQSDVSAGSDCEKIFDDIVTGRIYSNMQEAYNVGIQTSAQTDPDTDPCAEVDEYRHPQDEKIAPGHPKYERYWRCHDESIRKRDARWLREAEKRYKDCQEREFKDITTG